ncbi:MAG: CBS domain-containing protein [Candidatus Omnitrophica bacterium]|nr:CBS domain-containing protein [Candidatus Omnitrophota bacterium]
MKVKDILIKMPFNIENSTTLILIIKAMKETGLDILPIVNKDMRLVGIIGLDDIAKIFAPYSGPMQTLVKSLPFLDDLVEKDFSINHVSPEMLKLCIAEDIMDTNFITISQDTDLEKAYSIMVLHKVEIAPVTDDGHLLGIVRLLDIIQVVLKEKGLE